MPQEAAKADSSYSYVRPLPELGSSNIRSVEMQNIDIYYESLKQVYDQIRQWRELRKTPLGEKIVSTLWSITLVIFLASLVPLLPALLTFLASKAGLILGPINLSQATLGNFLIVWVAVAALTAAVFFLLDRIQDKPFWASVEDRTGPPQTLSPEQLTFIAVYESYKELKIFFISHLDQHAENSLEALRRVVSQSNRLRYLDVDLVGLPYRERNHGASLVDQIVIAQEFLRTFEQYDWFKLDAETKSTLQALMSLPGKAVDRLKYREDLPSVLEILDNLSKFIYAYLPEHKTYMDADSLKQLQAQGLDCLNRFVDKINNLTPYRSPKEEQKTKAKVSPKTWKDRLESWYQNVFFRFMLWFIILLILTSTMVLLAGQFLTLSSDTMATVVVGTSVAGAAALAAFLPRTPKSTVREQTDQLEETDAEREPDED
jgi:hypothetical protein